MFTLPPPPSFLISLENLSRPHLREYERLVWITDDPETQITNEELFSLREKTNRHLRLRELLLEYSEKSNLIAM